MLFIVISIKGYDPNMLSNNLVLLRNQVITILQAYDWHLVAYDSMVPIGVVLAVALVFEAAYLTITDPEKMHRLTASILNSPRHAWNSSARASISFIYSSMELLAQLTCGVAYELRAFEVIARLKSTIQIL